MNTVTLLQSPSTESLPYLQLKSNLLTKRIQSVSDASTISLILNILEKQQSPKTIENIQIMIPSVVHHKLYQTLIHYPQTNLHQFIIRDPTDDGYIIHHEDHVILKEFLSTTLIKSQSTLNQLEMSSFPSDIFLSQFNTVQFPSVTALKIALVGNTDNYHGYWRQFKFIFPNLQQLVLTLTKQNLPLFKYLMNDVSLFPWIKRLSIVSRETPKNYLTREELRSSLIQLNGLNRITAGWDMIALN
jgi:hypothetical protein